MVFSFDGEWIQVASTFGVNADGVAATRNYFPMRPGLGSVTAQAIRDAAVVNVADVLALPETEYLTHQVARSTGYRGLLSVPMLRDGQVVGAITVMHPQVGQFVANEVDLLETFASQAVIAIENVRLFKELQARTTELTRSVEQLGALSEVGQAVSSTLDLETVLRTIVSRATQLAGMDGGAIYEYDEVREEFRLHAADRLPDELVEALRSSPPPKGEGAIGRLATHREPVAISDIMDEGAYQSRVREILLGLGYRSLLAVPLL
ncbi:GAF domain-containing protein [Polaromonas sp. P1(28)-13]|nr:GAF domain-containing protein [Polaromonas sp. P1(28)-13]